MSRRRTRTAWTLALLSATGCASQRGPLPPDAFVRAPLAVPQLNPAPPAAELPAPPVVAARAATGSLSLRDVLTSVEEHFPLLYAVEQERAIAAGQRLSAEGQFDTVLRARASEQAGTFSNGRVDVGVETPLTEGGVTTFAGWRLGGGNFPIYYGDRKTADGGEFRAGVTVPLLQNRDTDPRRARLRAAQITEQLADPAVRRARLDFQRNAAQTYWVWQAAGAQYRVAAELAELATKRQEVIDVRQKGGLISASAPALNRRLVASRQEAQLAAERQVQQAALRLSLFWRGPEGDPIVPPADTLLADFLALEPTPPDPTRLQADVTEALARRPELARFQLEKERRAVELKLATNQELPTLNVFAGVSQDAGFAKKTFTGDGPFTTDRTAAEAGASFEVPLPRRDARGRVRAAQAQLAQLLGQERFARDEIVTQVQDAVSELTLTYARLGRARAEQVEANKVLAIEAVNFAKQQTSLFELNLQEVAAAEARVRVVASLGQYLAAVANYQAVLGLDATQAAEYGSAAGATAPSPRTSTSSGRRCTSCPECCSRTRTSSRCTRARSRRRRAVA